MHKALSNTLAKLDLKAEVPKLNLKHSDLKKLRNLDKEREVACSRISQLET